MELPSKFPGVSFHDHNLVKVNCHSIKQNKPGRVLALGIVIALLHHFKFAYDGNTSKK